MDTEFSSGFLIECAGGDGSTVEMVLPFRPLVAFFIAVNQDTFGLVASRTTSSFCMGIASRNLDNSTNNMVWGETFVGPTNGGAGTHMFDDRCVQTYDTTSYTTPLQAHVSAWSDDSFTLTFDKAIAGRLVWGIALGGPEDPGGVKQQNGYGVVNIGTPANLAFLFQNYVVGHLTSNPFGGLIWATDDDTSVKGNGYCEYTLQGPLHQSGRGWGWPPLVNNTTIIPTYDPWYFGMILGTWQESHPHASGWNFPSPGRNVAIEFATTVPTNFARQRTSFAGATTTFADTYTPGSILTCGPAHVVGWQDSGPGNGHRLYGTGFGVETKDASIRCALGAGQDDAGHPYSWMYDDRSWVSVIDRTTPALVRAGHIEIDVGSYTLIDDDTPSGENNVGCLCFGPAPGALASFSPVTEPVRRAGSFPTVKG